MTHNNGILVGYNSLIVKYDYNGIEQLRIDLKSEYDVNQLDQLEIDSYGNIWIFIDTGLIYILDSNYKFKKIINDLEEIKIKKCLDIINNNETSRYCAYYNQNSIGILFFSFNDNAIPMYQDFFPMPENSNFIDLDFSEGYIYLSTDIGTYIADINSNLKLPSSWELSEINLNESRSKKELFLLNL